MLNSYQFSLSVLCHVSLGLSWLPSERHKITFNDLKSKCWRASKRVCLIPNSVWTDTQAYCNVEFGDNNSTKTINKQIITIIISFFYLI